MAAWPTPHYRRRRLLSIAAIFFVLGTLLWCYKRFSMMPLTAQGLPAKVPAADNSEATSTPTTSTATGTDTAAASSSSTATPSAYDEAPEEPISMAYGTYGRPPLKNMVQLGTLAPEHLPAPSSPARLILIGDVHGQLSALKALLKKVEYAAGRGDHVVFAGDLVAKGPDSAGVVALAMEMGASAVRGNHEDRVLLAYDNMQTPHIGDAREGKAGVAGDAEDKTDDMVEPAFSHGDYAARAVAKSLSAAQRAWLRTLPVTLKLGRVPSYGNVVAVHAGLVPDVPLEAQDPWAVMNMRSLLYPAEELRRERVKKRYQRRNQKPMTDAQADAEMEASRARGEGANDFDVMLPVDGQEGQSWSEVWNQVQDEKADEADRLRVVYGHDSKTGLNVQKYTYGLDSGCVKGGQLTALIFESGAGVEAVTHRLVSVECQEARGSDKTDDDGT